MSNINDNLKMVSTGLDKAGFISQGRHEKSKSSVFQNRNKSKEKRKSSVLFIGQKQFNENKHSKYINVSKINNPTHKEENLSKKNKGLKISNEELEEEAGKFNLLFT
jgi:hypothetical protein